MTVEIDGFRIVDEIGRGGFGTVHRADDVAHGRQVAIKVLEGIPNDDARRRFDRERRAMGTLSGHPNIAVVHTSGALADGRPYLVMEMLQGGSLADRLVNGPLSLDEALSVADALCDAMSHAHGGGVLHLDLKPENVLFSSFGRPKIVDFGIAALIDDEAGTTTIRATPAYADPEVLDGKAGTVRSDVYGLAATIYSALSGEQPYGAEGGAYTVLRRVASEQVPRVRRPDVPAPVADTLQRAMAKEPAHRPDSIDELRRELTEAARFASPAPPPPVAAAAPTTATWTPTQRPDPAFVPPDTVVPATSAYGRQTTIGIGLLVASLALLVLILATQL